MEGRRGPKLIIQSYCDRFRKEIFKSYWILSGFCSCYFFWREGRSCGDVFVKLKRRRNATWKKCYLCWKYSPFSQRHFLPYRKLLFSEPDEGTCDSSISEMGNNFENICDEEKIGTFTKLSLFSSCCVSPTFVPRVYMCRTPYTFIYTIYVICIHILVSFLRIMPRFFRVRLLDHNHDIHIDQFTECPKINFGLFQEEFANWKQQFSPNFKLSKWILLMYFCTIKWGCFWIWLDNEASELFWS